MDDPSPIRVIKGIPALLIAIIAFALAFAVDTYILPGHLRIILFSAVMSGFAIYSSLDIMKKPFISFLVSAYVLIHILISILAPADDSYYGAVLIPAAILDYIAFVYAAYFVYKTT